jgi:hypothetical protein
MSLEPLEPLEPTGGCFYKPHMMMVNSGQFWRCKHGYTFVKNNCIKCAVRNPLAALRWHFPRLRPREAR